MRMDGRWRVNDKECERIDIFGCENDVSEQMSSGSIKPGPADKATLLERPRVISKGFEDMV